MNGKKIFKLGLASGAVILFAFLYRRNEVPDYPKNWAYPSFFKANKKGPCLNIEGTYTEVDEELQHWLEPPDRNPNGLRPWDEHKATVTQADDGSWIEMRFQLNEKGLPPFIKGSLEFNDDFRPRGTVIRLKKGQDYECDGNWIENLYFPQDEMFRGIQRLRLVFGLDGEGNLIAGRTQKFLQAITFWSDGQKGFEYQSTETRWRRWPKRDPAAEAELEKLYKLEIRRYSWLNKNDSVVPIRLQSFLGQDICLRLWDTTDSSGYPDAFRTGTVLHFDGCPKNYYYLKPLNVVRFELNTPQSIYHAGSKYRVTWFPVESPQKVTEIDLPESTSLPLMPESKSRH